MSKDLILRTYKALGSGYNQLYQKTLSVLKEKYNVITTIDGTEHNTIVISKSSATTAQSRTYNVETRSPAALLDYPFAIA